LPQQELIVLMKTKGYAAAEQGAELKQSEIELPALGANDVLLKVSHCGICHSDLHLIHNDWRSSKYPLVPGHEVIGHLIEKGEGVGHLEIGQRLGVGWQSGACLQCEWCISGRENLCPNSKATCVGRHGGFADHLVVDSNFAFPIPAALGSEDAAPLLCGGITVYSPLRRYGVEPWHKVGIVGIGGLGHLAIQFAAKFGAEVWALSSSASKEAEAKSLGATHFFDTSADPSLKALRKSLDFILVAATADLDWKPYVKALRPGGRLCFVTGESTLLNIPASMLLDGEVSISGSVIGGRAMMREMLEFAARHQVKAKTVPFPASQVNMALDKLAKNEIRYRAVLGFE
jgi:uncharacterized zinc-type alcohol dehydrogenase-like protein